MLFATASIGITARMIQSGVIADGFDGDCYMATAMARHYLLRPAGSEVVDMYTHGFLHPALYVPLLALMQGIGVPPPLQDGLAIAFVQALAVGLIALLAFAGSRALLNRTGAVSVCLLCIFYPLLWRPLDSALTPLSPNGEILGSVLLLGLWCVLLQGFQGRSLVGAVVVLSVAAFHLKYQLMPQVVALILGAGLGGKRALRLLLMALATCLLVDLMVYRLGHAGLLSRAGSLLFDYIGLGGQADGADPAAGFSLRGLAVSLVIQLSILAKTAPAKAMALLRLGPTLWREAPQVLLAWSVWLIPLLNRRLRGPRFGPQLGAALLLSLATMAAIVLPGKNFSHYYLLFLPTAVVVMATGLGHVPRIAEPMAPAPMGLPQVLLWAPLLAFVPALTLLVGDGLQRIQAFQARGELPIALLPPETHQSGIHVFGWDYRLFGQQDTYPSAPSLDMRIVSSWSKSDPGDYIKALVGPSGRPRFLLDHVASPTRGGILAAAQYPPLAELARREGVDLSRFYRIRQINALGILYELVPDPPPAAGQRS